MNRRCDIMRTTDTATVAVMGVSLAPGDHVCAFYPGAAERNEILIPYLQEGLDAGDKCICIVSDAIAPDDDLDSVRCHSHHSDQLAVDRSGDTYLKGGSFSSARMLQYWDSAISQAMEDGYTFARGAGEMTWALETMPGVENLVTYESELNDFLKEYPAVIVCLYELGRFSGELLVEVLKTHPKVILGGIVLENPYYLHHAEYLASR
jgi:MEDS: MEthanogen/methylotroph, DcmR Sensory domain